jgi:hypothetical protein
VSDSFFISLGVEALKMFGERRLPPEHLVHLCIIEDAVDAYLCGVYDEKIEFFNRKEHIRAREFIFETVGDFSFQYHWELAFPNIDISIEHVRKVLLNNFKRRWRKYAKNNGNGRREGYSDADDHDQYTGNTRSSPTSKWVESILFGTGAKRGNEGTSIEI